MVSGLSKKLWTKIVFLLAAVTKDVMRVQCRRLYFRAVIKIERVADRRNVMNKRYCKVLTSFSYRREKMTLRKQNAHKHK